MKKVAHTDSHVYGKGFMERAKCGQFVSPTNNGLDLFCYRPLITVKFQTSQFVQLHLLLNITLRKLTNRMDNNNMHINIILKAQWLTVLSSLIKGRVLVNPKTPSCMYSTFDFCLRLTSVGNAVENCWRKVVATKLLTCRFSSLRYLFPTIKNEDFGEEVIPLRSWNRTFWNKNIHTNGLQMIKEPNSCKN